MSIIFILTIIFVFLTILVESINLILQLKGKKLSKWFGKRAFNYHAVITGAFWIMTFLLIIILQFESNPRFHNNMFLIYIGAILVVVGLILALTALRLLGLKRTLCLNFFEKKVPMIKSSLYKYVKNPMDTGFWMALIGFALFTRSNYNLIIAVEFIVIMIPHAMLENIPLK